MPSAVLDAPRTDARRAAPAPDDPTRGVLPRDHARPVRHLPRRSASATGVLRALDPASAEGPHGSEGATDASGSTAAVRSPRTPSLRVRDLLTGGVAASGSFALAAHLGLLGTAGGTFVTSVASAVIVALSSDSLSGLRRGLLHLLRRRPGAARSRTARSRGGDGA